MKKQILLIVYSLISIVFGLLLATEYNSFEFLIPIPLVTMLSVYFLCRMDEKVNFKGMGVYLLSLAITFAILFIIPRSVPIDDIRLMCMEILSVMFVILGGLAGGILRYEFYRIEKEKKKDGE